MSAYTTDSHALPDVGPPKGAPPIAKARLHKNCVDLIFEIGW